PGDIPNPEAKPYCADGTARGSVWESRTPPNSVCWKPRWRGTPPHQRGFHTSGCGSCMYSWDRGKRGVWECTKRGRLGKGAGPAAAFGDPTPGLCAVESRHGRGECCGRIGAMTYRIRTVRAEEWELLRELRLAALADPAASVAFNETYEDA